MAPVQEPPPSSKVAPVQRDASARAQDGMSVRHGGKLLEISDAAPLKGSPNFAGGSVEAGNLTVAVQAGRSSLAMAPAWMQPCQWPAVEADAELVALSGITPAPLGRNVRKWQLRQSGALVQDTPAPLAQAAGALLGAGCPDTQRASLPKSGKEAIFRPLGGGVQKYGLVDSSSPGLSEAGASPHNAATVAALPLAVGLLAPGGSAALPSSHATAYADGSSSANQGLEGIPEPPLKLWTVGGIILCS
ncbi:hypothetical protein N2152v2_002994 [Parachlorella kessleri]